MLYYGYNTGIYYFGILGGKTMTKEGFRVDIDFDSDEALYMQVRNQVITQIACGELKKGDSLPSVRQLASLIGINMHTVNKAYALLRQEGYLKIDRRSGARVDVEYRKGDDDKEIAEDLGLLVARARCKGISAEALHRLIDEEYEKVR